MKEKRVFLLVIDGFGVGASPDSKLYGDEGSNTFLNLYRKEKMDLPNLTMLGLKNIDGIELKKDNFGLIGSYGKMQELSVGKDTTTGHFEMMDIISSSTMPTYPNGFPMEIVKELEKEWGIGVLANKTASGTEIIKEFGKEHLETKKPILYTSADSVMQIATHTDVYSIEELYKMCEIARKIMKGENAVGRVIARPFFTNSQGEFERLNTARKDFALSPKRPNSMSKLCENNFDVIAVGKIQDIFNNESITKSYANHTNKDAILVMKKLIKEKFNGLCFVNLVDTDMVYGHRNDTKGYAKSLKELDDFIPEIINNLNNEDFLIITGDHGCDPTTVSSDHSREYTPLLVYSKSLEKSENLGTLQGFNSIGKFIEKLFNLNNENSVVFDKLQLK